MHCYRIYVHRLCLNGFLLSDYSMIFINHPIDVFTLFKCLHCIDAENVICHLTSESYKCTQIERYDPYTALIRP